MDDLTIGMKAGLNMAAKVLRMTAGRGPVSRDDLLVLADVIKETDVTDTVDELRRLEAEYPGCLAEMVSR